MLTIRQRIELLASKMTDTDHALILSLEETINAHIKGDSVLTRRQYRHTMRALKVMLSASPMTSEMATATGKMRRLEKNSRRIRRPSRITDWTDLQARYEEA